MKTTDLNLETIREACRVDPDRNEPLRGTFLDSVLDVTGGVLDRYFEVDAKTYLVLGVEKLHTLESPEIDPLFVKCYIDLELVNKNTGEHLVVDWKTTGMDLGNYYGRTKFKSLYQQSWQGKTYVAGSDISKVIFRGCSTETTSFYEVVLTVKNLEENNKRVESYYGAYADWLRKLETRDMWPQNWDSCEKFGGCRYKNLCATGANPIYPFKVDKLVNISFSSIKNLADCPEKARLDWQAKIEDTEIVRAGSEEAEFGKAVHRGLAEAYSQLKTWQENEGRK